MRKIDNSTEVTSTRPLAGIRIADFSAVFAGPYCTRMLHDLGAEVIKIEPPHGDSNRGAEPIRNGNSLYYGVLNAGKRSVVLDLKGAEDRQAAFEIAAGSDIVIENFRPGVMDRLGLGYEVVEKANRSVVYCSISGYGQTGPKAHRPATAQVIHAGVGFDSAFMDYQPTDMPPATGLFVADALAGALAMGAILAALRTAEVSGEGTHIDLSLEASLLSMLTFEVASAQYSPGFRRQGYRPARTSDGYVMVVPVNDRTFASLVTVIGRPELVEHEHFVNTAQRWRHYNELHAAIEDWSQHRSTAECEAAFIDVGVPASAYSTVNDLAEDPYLRERGALVPAEDASGQFLVPGLPFQLAGEAEPHRAAPLSVASLGEDTEAVLEELRKGLFSRESERFAAVAR